MSNSDEHKRRIDNKISAASATLMSNTKWRKLLERINPVTHDVQWKFIGDERIFTASIPSLLADTFGDSLPYPYGSYREIDWILIPHEFRNPNSDSKRPLPNLINDIPKIAELIEQLGAFPIELTAEGLKINGYTW